MAALGYVCLLVLNPLNSTGVRQAEPQRLFTMKSKKVSVYHSAPPIIPPVNGRKTLICAEMPLWVGATIGGCA